MNREFSCIFAHYHKGVSFMSTKLNAQQIIQFIATSKKVTPVKVYVNGHHVLAANWGEDVKVFFS